MKVASIGYTRDDGDFALLATLNNNDEHISDAEFKDLAEHIASVLRKTIDSIEILERQDTPDYVECETSQHRINP